MGGYQSSAQKPSKPETTHRITSDQPKVSNTAYYKLPMAAAPQVAKKKSEQEKKPMKHVEKLHSTESSDSGSEEMIIELDPKLVAEHSLAPLSDIDSDEASLKDDKRGSTSDKEVAERKIQEAFFNPHPSFVCATPVISVNREKVINGGIIPEFVSKDIIFSDECVVYDIPLETVGIRLVKNRISRSRSDPWRRHGALMKICEIGGTIPETKGRMKNQRFTHVKKGSAPPPAPKTKPLTTVDEFMIFKKKSKESEND
ncbi:unnamed protein product [Caenorhabditis bovis]|uniref:Uncharacterized protein n=1 Tax=Caenorhabditis bovis TaxID=2654633 RepID=A0A8S1F0W2_9PELO|nr:unnamed protein product [Caenorhabditis bovis]